MSEMATGGGQPSESGRGPRGGLIEIAEDVRNGRRSAVDTVRDALTAIEQRNAPLNACIEVDEEGALASAAELDSRIAAGEDVGRLAGVPFVVKEDEECRGLHMTNGSLTRADVAASEYDSLQVERLRAAGAIPVAGTAASEFGMDSVVSTRLWGTTRNPWNLDRTPGGSSGGSAAAVAAGIVPLGTGGDGGGSIRQPAACCGLAGHKVTRGLIPDRNIFPSRVATRGVLTATVIETARVLDVTVGPHPEAPTFDPAPGDFERTCRAADFPRTLRLRWSDLGYLVEPETAEVALAAARRLADAAGLELDEEPVTLPSPLAIWVEACASDVKGRMELLGVWPQSAAELCEATRFFLEEVLPPTSLGLIEHADRRADFERAVARVFTETDVLLTPTFCTAPHAADARWEDYASTINGEDATDQSADAYAMIANLTGQPSLSVHAGLDSDGLPVGLQLTGQSRDDGTILALGHVLDQAMDAPNFPSSQRRDK